MSKYTDSIDAAIGGRRTLARLAQVLGEESTALEVRRPSSAQEFLRSVHASAPKDVSDGVGTLAGAAAGAILWGDHRVLGFIGGGSIGRNLPAVFLRPDQRNVAFCNMGQTGAAVLGSLLMPRHPVIGFLAGALAGGAVIHFGGFRR